MKQVNYRQQKSKIQFTIAKGIQVLMGSIQSPFWPIKSNLTRELNKGKNKTFNENHFEKNSISKDYQTNIKELAEEFVILKQNSSQIFDDGKNEETNSRNCASSISNRDQSKHNGSKFKSQPFVKNCHMNYYKSLNQKQKVAGRSYPKNAMISQINVQRRRK